MTYDLNQNLFELMVHALNSALDPKLLLAADHQAKWR